MSEIKTVGIVGSGVIGAGWAARCLARGYNVIATDPAPGAEEIMISKIANAWPALIKIGCPLVCRNSLADTDLV